MRPCWWEPETSLATSRCGEANNQHAQGQTLKVTDKVFVVVVFLATLVVLWMLALGWWDLGGGGRGDSFVINYLGT